MTDRDLLLKCMENKVIYRVNQRGELEVKVFHSLSSYRDFMLEFELDCIGFNLEFDRTEWNHVPVIRLENIR